MFTFATAHKLLTSKCLKTSRRQSSFTAEMVVLLFEEHESDVSISPLLFIYVSWMIESGYCTVS